jgi:LacI family transcriptional regulator
MKRVTLKDIAKKVGVSTALVSYVMNGKEKGKSIGKDVVKKIRQTAEDLNYQPNEIARSLKYGSTKTIGLVVADIANPFFGYLARCIENEALKFGYAVIIGSSDEVLKKSELLINTLINRQVDGFIVAPAEGTENQINNILKKKIPLILVDRFFPEIDTNYIVIDNYQSTYDATSYLIKRGYKKIVFIGYKSSMIHMTERKRGYTEAMQTYYLGKNTQAIEVSSLNTKTDIERTFLDLLFSEKKIDALIFATNLLSIEGLYCIQKNNIKIPEDIGLIGYDGGDCFNLFYSPVTYIEQPIEELAAKAINRLMDCFINGETSSKTLHTILKSKLIIRNSC